MVWFWWFKNSFKRSGCWPVVIQTLIVASLGLAPTLGLAGDESGLAQERNSLSWAGLGRDAISPLENSSGWILGGGLAVSGLTLWYESTSDQRFQRWMVAHHPIGNWSRFGDLMGQAIPNFIYAGAMLIDSTIAPTASSSRLAARRARLMIEATLWASALSTALKYAVHEERPDHSDWASYPSGHATTAFAFASIVALEHPWYWGAAAYGLASFVGLSRINDNRHYLHDVVAGAAIGTAFGVGVWKEVGRREPIGTETASSLELMPIDQGGFIILSTRHF